MLCLPPDVLFRDEFTPLHSAIVIYIGTAWTNEGFFSPQRKDKDRRRRKLFAIWSINKNANSGKPFLSCDNGGVVIAAPQRQTDGPTRILNPKFFIVESTEEFKNLRAIFFFFFSQKMLGVGFFPPEDDILAQKQVLNWPHGADVGVVEQAKVRQSLSMYNMFSLKKEMLKTNEPGGQKH